MSTLLLENLTIENLLTGAYQLPLLLYALHHGPLTTNKRAIFALSCYLNRKECRLDYALCRPSGYKQNVIIGRLVNVTATEGKHTTSHAVYCSAIRRSQNSLLVNQPR
jgi:hypothetical protein